MTANDIETEMERTIAAQEQLIAELRRKNTKLQLDYDMVCAALHDLKNEVNLIRNWKEMAIHACKNFRTALEEAGR